MNTPPDTQSPDSRGLPAVPGSPFTYGETLRIVRLSETIPLHAQGGGKPRVGDIVRVGADTSAVNVPAYRAEPWYWCIGKNDSGEYGAKFTHGDLVRIIPPPRPEDFGYEAADGYGDNGNSGWQIEGGEEAYDAALAAWRKANARISDTHESESTQ